MSTTLVQRDLDAPEITLGQAIEMLRASTGMSARALSLTAGLSESYVGKLEKDHLEPSLKAFATITRCLGLKPSEVYALVTRAGLAA